MAAAAAAYLVQARRGGVLVGAPCHAPPRLGRGDGAPGGYKTRGGRAQQLQTLSYPPPPQPLVEASTRLVTHPSSPHRHCRGRHRLAIPNRHRASGARAATSGGGHTGARCGKRRPRRRHRDRPLPGARLPRRRRVASLATTPRRVCTPVSDQSLAVAPSSPVSACCLPPVAPLAHIAPPAPSLHPCPPLLPPPPPPPSCFFPRPVPPRC